MTTNYLIRICSSHPPTVTKRRTSFYCNISLSDFPSLSFSLLFIFQSLAFLLAKPNSFLRTLVREFGHFVGPCNNRLHCWYIFWDTLYNKIYSHLHYVLLLRYSSPFDIFVFLANLDTKYAQFIHNFSRDIYRLIIEKTIEDILFWGSWDLFVGKTPYLVT